MHLHLVPILLHLSLVPVEALLKLADEGVVPPVDLLLLLPLQGVLLGPVIVHLLGVEAAPPDVKLVLAQLTLPAPLLCVGTAYVELNLTLPGSGPGAALPGAGVADVGVNTFNVQLPVTSLAKALSTMLALKSSDLVMNSFYVLGKIRVLTKLQATFFTLVALLLPMNSLEVHSHCRLLSKPLATLWTLVVHSLMHSLLMSDKGTNPSITLGTAFYITLESFYLGMRGAVSKELSQPNSTST